MPYIKQDKRLLFDSFIKELTLQLLEIHRFIDSRQLGGNLNYIISKIIFGLCDKNKGCELSYVLINDIIGALENCKLEFTRRITIPYEDTKIKDNGDII